MALVKKKESSQKKDTVAQLRAALGEATIAVVADYRGLTVSELTDLRNALFKESAQFTVAKNTLARRAVEGTDLEVLKDYFKGPTALLLGRADQVVPVKLLKDFLKKNKKENEVRGAYLDGQVLSASEVDELAKLPSFNDLRAKLLGCIASPQNGLVNAISSQQRGLVNVLDQYVKQQDAKQEQS